MNAHTGSSYLLGALLTVALLAAITVVDPDAARAQGVAPPDGDLASGLEGHGAGSTAGEWAFSVGAGAGFAPDYEGSEDYEPVPLLFARIQRDQIFVALEANTLRANLLPAPVFRAGPLVRYRRERDDVENDAVDDLEDVDAAVELGGFAGFEAAGWHGSVEITHDVADAYDGWLLGVKGGYRAVFSPNLSLNTTAFTTYAGDDYMETYFGIDGADAARSGLDTFDADGGFKDAGLSLAAHYGGQQGWGVNGLAAYKRLLGDAEDSPVVDDEGDANQFFAGLLLIYGF